MSLNGRLSGLRPRLQYANRLLPRSQRRALNEFISRRPDVQPKPDDTSFVFAVKDNIATLPKDGATTCASAILAGYESPFEATIVKQLKSLGGVCVGKTNMDEFGMGSHSTNSVHGPVAQELEDGTKVSAGGSSGGSALAVATGAADIALGTDTGGSVRLPAAYCGVVGYKPSYGMISRHGVVPYANSLDTVGFFARDAAVLRDLIISKGLAKDCSDSKDPTCVTKRERKPAQEAMGFYHSHPLKMDPAAALKMCKIGLPVQYNIEELDPSIRQGWVDVTEFLVNDVGVKVVPVSLPTTKHALSAYYVIAPAEASSNLAKYDGVRYGPKQSEIEKSSRNDSGTDSNVLYSTLRGQLFGDEVKRRILLGSYTLSSKAIDNYFLQAQRVRQLVRNDFNRVFTSKSVLLDDDAQQFPLAEMDENIEMENKLGPTTVDFILSPTAPTLPPKLEDVKAGQERSPVDSYLNDVFTVPASLAGLPAISIPKKVDGPPGGKNVMGVQLVAQHWGDGRLLFIADCLQRLWKEKKGEPMYLV